MSKVEQLALTGNGVLSSHPDYVDIMVRRLADGPCLCAEIDPKDRPCLTCEAQEALRADGAS